MERYTYFGETKGLWDTEHEFQPANEHIGEVFILESESKAEQIKWIESVLKECSGRTANSLSLGFIHLLKLRLAKLRGLPLKPKCVVCGVEIWNKDIHLKNNVPCHVRCDESIPVRQK